MKARIGVFYIIRIDGIVQIGIEVAHLRIALPKAVAAQDTKKYVEPILQSCAFYFCS